MLTIHPADGVFGELEEVTFDVVFAPDSVESNQCRLLCLVDPSLACGVEGTKESVLEVVAHGTGVPHPAMAVPELLSAWPVAVVGDCVAQSLRLVNPCRAPANFKILGAGPEIHAIPAQGCIPPESAVDVSVEVLVDQCSPVATSVTCEFEHGAAQRIQVLIPRVKLPDLRVDTSPLDIGALRLGETKAVAVALFNRSSRTALPWCAREIPPPSALPLLVMLAIREGSVVLSLRERSVNLSLQSDKGSVPPGSSAAVLGVVTAVSPGSYSAALAITSEGIEHLVGISCQVIEPRLVHGGGQDCLALGDIYQAVPRGLTLSFTNVSSMPAEWSARNGGRPVGCHAEHVLLGWSSKSGTVPPGETLVLELEVTVVEPGAVDVLFALDVRGSRATVVQQLTAHCFGLQVEFDVSNAQPGEERAVEESRESAAGRVVDFGRCIPVGESRTKWLQVRNCGGISTSVRFWVDEFPDLQNAGDGSLVHGGSQSRVVLNGLSCADTVLADTSQQKDEDSQSRSGTRRASAGQTCDEHQKRSRDRDCGGATPVGIRLDACHETEAPFGSKDGNRIIKRRRQRVSCTSMLSGLIDGHLSCKLLSTASTGIF
jgi:hypothetical protein